MVQGRRGAQPPSPLRKPFFTLCEHSDPLLQRYAALRAGLREKLKAFLGILNVFTRFHLVVEHEIGIGKSIQNLFLELSVNGALLQNLQLVHVVTVEGKEKRVGIVNRIDPLPDPKIIHLRNFKQSNASFDHEGLQLLGGNRGLGFHEANVMDHIRDAHFAKDLPGVKSKGNQPHTKALSHQEMPIFHRCSPS